MKMLRAARTLTPLVIGPFIFAAGCGGTTTTIDPTTATLSKVTTATTTACPTGGVTITSGVDTNGNGVLDDAEVTQTNNVCNGSGSTGMNGTPGTSTLVSTSALPVGDPNCANGGTEIDFGLDNGAGGGTAGDGILQAGEITSKQYVCNGGPLTYPGTDTPPTGTGSSKISLIGGAATTGAGGYGGSFTANMDSPTLGGAVKMYATGTVEASVTAPTVTINAGTNPCTLSGTVTVKSYADVTAAGSDACYALDSDSTHLYTTVGGVATLATGLVVPAGAKVTLPGIDGFEFSNDVSVAGTLGTVLEGGAPTALEIVATGTVVVSGTIDVSAPDVTGGSAQGGATLQITASRIVSTGTLRADGGSGDSAGSGGSVTLSTLTDNGGAGVYNTGTISAGGGTGAGGAQGGTIELLASSIGVFNSGALSANGGASTDGNDAGAGGSVSLGMGENSAGNIVSIGAVTATGGACQVAGCGGGSGGNFEIDGDSGQVSHNASVDVSGGASVSATGGRGGNVYFFDNADGNSGFFLSSLSTGSIHVTGNLTANGGAGVVGGNAGQIDAELDVGNFPSGQEVAFYGYTDVLANGGASTSGSGGYGGDVELKQQGDNRKRKFETATLWGPVFTYANLSARGGSGVEGGLGGTINLLTQDEAFSGSTIEVASNFATLDASAGDATSGSGAISGGTISLNGVYSVTNSGTILATGGAGTERGGEVDLASGYGPITNAGKISVVGGGSASTVNGGGGGIIEIDGNPATNTSAGSLLANGGNGTTLGGDGGRVVLSSSSNGPSVNAGTISAKGGTGGTPTDGSVSIDSVSVAP